MLDLLHHRGVGHTVGGLAADGDGTHGLAVEGTDRGDVPASARCDTGQFQSHLNSLGTAVGEEALLQIAGGDVCHGLCEISAKRIQQLLRVQGLMVELGSHDLHDLGIAVAAGVDAEAAQAVDELLVVETVDVGALVIPLEDRAVLGIGGDRLAILQPARGDVVVEVVQRVADHLLLFVLRDVLRVLADETDDLVEIADDLLFVRCHENLPFLNLSLLCTLCSLLRIACKKGAWDLTFVSRIRLCIRSEYFQRAFHAARFLLSLWYGISANGTREASAYFPLPEYAKKSILFSWKRTILSF